jgi:hypothetical protein
MLGVLSARIERMSAVSEAPEVPSPPVYRNSDVAPFIYFDVVAAYGVLTGSIEIELAARILSPAVAGKPVEFITAGRLRCSPTAAAQLREAVNSSLKMLQLPVDEASAASMN